MVSTNELKDRMKFRTPLGKVITLKIKGEHHDLVESSLSGDLSEIDIWWMIGQGMLIPVQEPILIPIDEWEPQEGDVVRWPGPAKKEGERFESKVNRSKNSDELIFIGPDTANWVALPIYSLRPLIRAANVEIWREQV